MDAEHKIIETTPQVEQRIQAVKVELFDLIKQIDIASVTRQNRLRELQILEDKLDKLKAK